MVPKPVIKVNYNYVFAEIREKLKEGIEERRIGEGSMFMLELYL